MHGKFVLSIVLVSNQVIPKLCIVSRANIFPTMVFSNIYIIYIGIPTHVFCVKKILHSDIHIHDLPITIVLVRVTREPNM